MPRRSYKDLNLAQLRSFCEVCEQGGYAAAARTLLLTTPAVWEQIQALERHYDCRLFERHGNGIRPTAKGRLLLDMIRPILAGLDSTKEVLEQQSGEVPRQIAMVTNLRVLVDQVSRALRQFHEAYPGVRLRIHYTSIDEVEPLVRDDRADVALTLEPRPDVPVDTSILYEPASELDYLLVVPADHPLARQRSLHLAQILRYPLVLGEAEAYSRRRVQEVLHRYNLLPAARVVAETSSDEYTLACVRSGIGVGITVGVPEGPLYEGLATRSLRRWFGTARVGFFWKRGLYVPAVRRALAESIRAAVRS